MTPPASARIGIDDAAPGIRVANAISTARRAQRYWSELSVRKRLDVVRVFRGLMADRLPQVVSSVAGSRHVPDAEILVSEILPLLDAAKFLERSAEKVLSIKKPSGQLRPLWLGSIDLQIRREPLGVVLVIGASNYPLLLAGVQVLQALVAGNAVMLKAGRNATPALRVFHALLLQAGLDPNLLHILPEDETEVRRCLAAGVDKVLLTGSAATGREVLSLAAESLTPVTAELSGADAVFVLARADVSLAARAIVFGLELNRSRTCMRPHRIFVHESVRRALTDELAKRVSEMYVVMDAETYHRANRLVCDAESRGARVIGWSKADPRQYPILIENVPAFAELASADIFAPILLIESFTQIGKAVQSYGRCPFALGASIFAATTHGGRKQARQLAERINAGFVVINDVVVPTADPRLPFSGRGRSGFGVTRGEEGLLELTQVKAIATRKSGYRHLEPMLPGDGKFFSAFVQLMHGANLAARWQAIKQLVIAARERRQEQRKQEQRNQELRSDVRKGREQ